MITKYLADKNVIGSTCVESLDGGLILMYSSLGERRFLKSFDNFRTVADEWSVPSGPITASANLIRLNDGKLGMLMIEFSQDPDIRKNLGASFYFWVSEDDGRSFYPLIRINQNDGCYYVMNNRFLRTSTGRILLPACYVPKEQLGEGHFEHAGLAGSFYSDDEGKTWQEGKWLCPTDADQLAEPMLMQGEDGVIHMYARTGVGYLYRSRSLDGGVSFEPSAASCLRSPCAPYCVAYDKYSKKYFAVWDNSFPSPIHQYPRCPICLAASDDAVDWRLVFELDNDPSRSYGYPMIHFDKQEMLITYYESPCREFIKEQHKLKLRIIPRDELAL